ncbi:MAG TPA: hypothetical protein DIV86_02855 [Alphaproteobacteria bacterium]|nr:hypothetical protein [Alphaproteobacteria bacterium]
MKKLIDLCGKLLMVLFLTILLFGLVAWGIGDILRNSAPDTVATVGSTPVTKQEYDRTVNNSSQQISLQLPEDVREKILNYIKRSSLQQLINQKLIFNEAEKLGILVDGAEIIKNEYLTIPSFTKEKLQNYITNEGGEKFFLEKIEKEKQSQILESAIISLVPYTDHGYNSLYSFEKQVRNIVLLEINNDQNLEARKPAESEIREFYEKNKNSFLSEETRSFSYVVISEKSVRGYLEQDGSEKIDIAQGFNRVISEMLDMLAAEKSLEEIVEQLKLEIVLVNNFSIESSSDSKNLPKIDGLLETVFSQDEGIVSDLLENESGDLYAFTRVDSISGRRVRALDEVRPQVEKLWAEQERTKKLGELAKKISESLLESKKTIDEVASEYNLKTSNIEKIYRDYPDLPQGFLNEIFKINVDGFTNPYKVSSGGYLIAKVTRINENKKIDELEKLELKVNIQEQLQQEILSQYLSYLSSKYRVKADVQADEKENE